MTLIRKRLAVLLAVIFLAYAPFALLAADTSLPETPKGFKMGLEVELLPEKLANLMHYFDFAKLEKEAAIVADGAETSLREELFLLAREKQWKLAPELGDLTKNYLRNNPSAYWSLPEPLRKQLGEGLQLQKVMLEQRTAILGADEKPLQKKSGLILPDAPARPEPLALQKPKLVLPGAQSTAQPAAQAGVVDAKLFQSNGSIQVPNTVEWDKLIARWEALPEEIRNPAVKLELLPPLEKAFLFAVTVKSFDAHGPQVELKGDLDEKEKAFWRKLSWKRDGDAIEFVHTEPVASPQEFLNDVRAFGRRAGIERELFDPERAEMSKFLRDRDGNVVYEKGAPVRKAKQWGSFHYHYSLPEVNLRRFAYDLNVNLLVRRLERGITSDLSGSGAYGFKEITGRGLMRMLGTNNQIENRTHLDPLEEELHRQLTPLFTKSTEEAALVIKADTERRLNDEIVRKLMASEKAYIMKLYEFDYTSLIQKLEGEVVQPGAQAEAVRALATLRPASPAFGPYFQRLLATSALKQADLDMLREWLEKGGEGTADVRAQIARLLRSAIPGEVKLALGLMSSKYWPEKLAPFEAAEAAKFLNRLQANAFDDAEIDVLTMGFAEKHWRGNREFIPVAERFLTSYRFGSLKQSAENFLVHSFPGDHELFRRLGPAFAEVPANTVPAQVQSKIIDRLEFWPNKEELAVISEILGAYGKLEEVPLQQFKKFYLPQHQPKQGEIKLAYRLGEFHPELRERALKDIHLALERVDIPILDLVADLGLHDADTLRLVKNYGDKGNTQLAVKVRGIIAAAKAAKAAAKSCPATFAKVAKRKRGS